MTYIPRPIFRSGPLVRKGTWIAMSAHAWDTVRHVNRLVEDIRVQCDTACESLEDTT